MPKNRPTQETPRLRGFALLTPAQRQKMASAGGTAAHKQGRGHQWSGDEARQAAKRSAAVRTEKALKAIGAK